MGKNVSEGCRVMGASRRHFYDIKKAHDEKGIEGLKREAPEVEEAVVRMAIAYPA